jgi:hypothetical protein
MRVQVPPPKRPVKKYSEGWKKARPDKPAQKNSRARAQWFMRVLSS